MITLVVLALIVAVAKLWADLAALRDRVRAMEQPSLTAFPAGWSSVVAPIEEPTIAPLAEPQPERTARVLHGAAMAPQPAEFLQVDTEVTTPTRHPRESGDPSPELPTREPEEMDTRMRGDDDGDEPATALPTSTRRTLGFEDIFGRKLPIWAGGITLAVCGFLIVKYSIDAGLLSPLVRVIGGLLFGSGLIASAEAALQNEDRVRDPRVRQALSGAGVATLYAVTLVATNMYHLIPPLAAFLFMAATTVMAGGLSIRFGAPSAVLGLVGGLAAPALVSTGAPNVPLLAAYLSLAVGGLATLGRAQRWWWLGAAALVGGFGWGLVLIAFGALSQADALSVGAFLLLLGVGLPVLLFGGARGHLVRLLGTLVAALQLAALVATGGFAMLHWGLFGLLGLAAVWLSRREPQLADLPAPALTIALLLALVWPAPSTHDLTIVLTGAALIFGLPAAWRVWRSDARLSDAGAVAALAAAPVALGVFHFDLSDHAATLLSLLGVAVAGGIAALGWRVPSRQTDSRFALLVAAAGALAATAAGFALLDWMVAPAWAAIAGALLLLAGLAKDRRVEALAWCLATAATVVLVLFPPAHLAAFDRALGEGHRITVVLDIWEALRWAVPALVALLFATESRSAIGRRIAAAAAVLIGYVAAAQVVPPALVPLIPALALAALGWARRSDTATATAGVLAVAWAAWPVATWLAGCGGAVLGFPLYVDALPGLADTATRLLAPAAAAAILLWRHPPADHRLRHAWLAGVALLGAALAHIAYKQLFALHGPADFVRRGLAERTLWEALLALAAYGLSRRLPAAARGFGAASLAHLAWFTLLLHNPLWAEQAVGALPVVNLLLPVYALGFALLWAAGRLNLAPLADRARGWGQMLLALLFALSELRQVTHGTSMAGGGVGEAEDIARSLLAIAVAIGFLLFGIRRRQRDWRIASLIVMLGAVGKVFVFDASGLDGLLRIASFAALGFSLIGLGWLYSRYLPDDVDPTAATA